MDQPNARSLHSRAVPRTGGLAIMLGGLAGAAVLVVLGTPWVPGIKLARPDWPQYYPVFVVLLVLAVVSFADDRCHLRILWRLLMQLGVAVVLAYWLLSGVGLWELALAVLFLAWMTNLYNFMDGMDGLAGAMAVIGFATLAILAWRGDAYWAGLACSLVVMAVLGFLTQNLPPARLFMGDIGSISLGALAGFSLLWFHVEGLLSLSLGILLFSPFIVDASVTLLRRLFLGERFWVAHRSHYYQRLVRSGWGHGRTLLAEVLLMLALAASVLWAAILPTAAQWLIIALWMAAYLVIMVWIEKRTDR